VAQHGAGAPAVQQQEVIELLDDSPAKGPPVTAATASPAAVAAARGPARGSGCSSGAASPPPSAAAAAAAQTGAMGTAAQGAAAAELGSPSILAASPTPAASAAAAAAADSAPWPAAGPGLQALAGGSGAAAAAAAAAAGAAAQGGRAAKRQRTSPPQSAVAALPAAPAAGGCSAEAPLPVWFEVSGHTGRVHIHLAPGGTRPLGLSLPLELLLLPGLGGAAGLEATMARVRAARAQEEEGGLGQEGGGLAQQAGAPTAVQQDPEQQRLAGPSQLEGRQQQAAGRSAAGQGTQAAAAAPEPLSCRAAPGVVGPSGVAAPALLLSPWQVRRLGEVGGGGGGWRSHCRVLASPRATCVYVLAGARRGTLCSGPTARRAARAVRPAGGRAVGGGAYLRPRVAGAARREQEPAVRQGHRGWAGGGGALAWGRALVGGLSRGQRAAAPRCGPWRPADLRRPHHGLLPAQPARCVGCRPRRPADLCATTPACHSAAAQARCRRRWTWSRLKRRRQGRTAAAQTGEPAHAAEAPTPA
jgi:hypothetical protein